MKVYTILAPIARLSMSEITNVMPDASCVSSNLTRNIIEGEFVIPVIMKIFDYFKKICFYEFTFS